jgi:tellurite resistance protein TerB
MPVLANLKSILTGGVQKLSGRKDALEAVCAGAALVAAADGTISNEEIASTLRAIGANPNLAAAFSPAEIERTADAMLKRAQGGRVGQSGLLNEIKQVAADPEVAELVMLATVDVAESDGSIGDKERAVLATISKGLGIPLPAGV